MLIYGHRGAAGSAPENTLRSFRRAIQFGVDGIEFDVRCSRDDVPVVIHDHLVDRTVDAVGAVADYDLDQLQQMRMISGERIPTLQEVLQAAGSEVLLNVEIKESRACAAAWQVMQTAIASGTLEMDRILVSSFEVAALRLFRELSSHIRIGVLTNGTPHESYWALCRELHAVSANIDLASVDRRFVDRATAAGLDVMVYTVNSPNDAKEMFGLGVKAIFSDVPDEVMDYRDP